MTADVENGSSLADRARVPRLEVRGVTVRHGGVVANDAVSLTVDAGRIVGLIGPNGAGKTTLIDAVTGFVRSTGEVLLDGRPVSGLAVHRRARLGLARTWQSLELFGDLCVLDNVRVASGRERPAGVLIDVAADLLAPRRGSGDPAARALLHGLGLDADAERLPHELSLGARRRAGLARALAGRPAVVLLDEPAAGLAPADVRALVPYLRGLARSGTAVLLVDHDTELVFDVCDEVVVLDRGRVLARGRPAEIRVDPRVVAAYLGAAAGSDGSPRAEERGRTDRTAASDRVGGWGRMAGSDPASGADDVRRPGDRGPAR